MSIGVIMAGLAIASALTGLVTEAMKAFLAECSVALKPNLLAGIVAVVVAAALSAAYAAVEGVSWDAEYIVGTVALVVLSWLCSMLGYDKVIQTLGQIGAGVKGDGADE